MTCFPLRGKCRRQYVQANWIFRSVATLKSSETPFRAQRDGACQRSSNNVGYTVVLPPQPSGQLPRWGAKNVLPLNLIAFPRGEGCDTRIPSSKERRRSRPCEPIRSPSTVIPSEAEGSFLHCRHMHTCALVQTTPWCFLFRLSLAHDLPLCKKDPSTSALMTRKKDGSSHIVFHTAA